MRQKQLIEIAEIKNKSMDDRNKMQEKVVKLEQ